MLDCWAELLTHLIGSSLIYLTFVQSHRGESQLRTKWRCWYRERYLPQNHCWGVTHMSHDNMTRSWQQPPLAHSAALRPWEKQAADCWVLATADTQTQGPEETGLLWRETRALDISGDGDLSVSRLTWLIPAKSPRVVFRKQVLESCRGAVLRCTSVEQEKWRRSKIHLLNLSENALAKEVLWKCEHRHWSYCVRRVNFWSYLISKTSMVISFQHTYDVDNICCLSAMCSARTLFL